MHDRSKVIWRILIVTKIALIKIMSLFIIYIIPIDGHIIVSISPGVLVEESSTNTANRKIEVLGQILARNLN